MQQPTRWSVVVMAKAAVPGKVKTRLTRPTPAPPKHQRPPHALPPLSAEQAAAVHAAMLRCVLTRTRAWLDPTQSQKRADSPPAVMRWVLAMDDPQHPPPEAAAGGWNVVPQGQGDLGQRLDHVWQAERQRAADDHRNPESRGLHAVTSGPDVIYGEERFETRGMEGGGHGVVFFGVDCPDVPGEVLAQIIPSMSAGAVVGPVDDGGYWTLGCRGYRPQLLGGIDWGGPGVYDQTCRAAADAGVALGSLPSWHDVDEPADLDRLRRRLIGTSEPALQELEATLAAIVGPRPATADPDAG